MHAPTSPHQALRRRFQQRRLRQRALALVAVYIVTRGTRSPYARGEARRRAPGAPSLADYARLTMLALGDARFDANQRGLAPGAQLGAWWLEACQGWCVVVSQRLAAASCCGGCVCVCAALPPCVWRQPGSIPLALYPPTTQAPPWPSLRRWHG